MCSSGFSGLTAQRQAGGTAPEGTGRQGTRSQSVRASLQSRPGPGAFLTDRKKKQRQKLQEEYVRTRKIYRHGDPEPLGSGLSWESPAGGCGWRGDGRTAHSPSGCLSVLRWGHFLLRSSCPRSAGSCSGPRTLVQSRSPQSPSSPEPQFTGGKPRHQGT